MRMIIVDDLIYYWADGTWCYRDELSEQARLKGDDYESMTSTEYFAWHPEVAA